MKAFPARLRQILLAACCAGAAAARSPGPAEPAASPVKGAPKVGDLAWADAYCPSPDCDTAAYLPYRKTATSPLLVVEARGKDGDTLFRVAGSNGVRGWLGRKDILRSRPSALSGSLRGATAGPFSLDPGSLGKRLPREQNPYNQVGLIRSQGNVLDTLEFRDAPPLGMAAAPGSPAFPEGPRGSGFRGFVDAPFLDPEAFSFTADGSWRVTDDRRQAPVWRKGKVQDAGLTALFLGEGKADRAPAFAAFRSGRMAFSWKPKRSFLVDLVSSSADTVVPRQEDILHLGDVQAADLDGDGYPEWVVEIGRTYGDGAFRQLAVFSMGKALQALVVTLDGFGWEPGASTTIGTWWIGPGSGAGRRVYIASAEVPPGGDSGRAEAGAEKADRPAMEMAAIEIGADGKLGESRISGFRAIFYGAPGTKAEAERAAYKLGEGSRQANQKGGSISLRALPWRVGKDILWRPGLAAPASAPSRVPADLPGPSETVKIPRRK